MLIKENDGMVHLLPGRMQTGVVTLDNSFTLSCKTNIIVIWFNNHPWYLPHRLKGLPPHPSVHGYYSSFYNGLWQKTMKNPYIGKGTNKMGSILTTDYYLPIRTNDLS